MEQNQNNENNNLTIVETPDKKVKKKASLPQTQFDLQSTAQSILQKWKNNTQITLQWINVDEYEALVTDFNNLLKERTDAGSKRPTQTQNIINLDKDINKAIEQVKIAIYNKFGKENGKAYFAEFGIIKASNNSFRLPTDRNERVNALPLLTKACNIYQIETPDYKKEFFANILTKYQTAINENQATVNLVTTSVGNKNEVLQKIKEVMQALVLVIKANYPKTYQNELRAWGFQKEKY